MPSPVNVTLADHASQQLRSLSDELGLEDVSDGCVQLLQDLLGCAGARLLGCAGARLATESVPWPSFIADDHTPLEFSLAFNSDGSPPTLRILVEHLAPEPTRATNLLAARRLTERLAHRYQLPLDRFDAIADLFLPEEPQGAFSLWHSVAFRPDGRHELKVYLNPAVRGVERAPDLVAQAFTRLGLADAYDAVRTHAFRPGGGWDRFAFFALDLCPEPHSRVKVYVAHERARAAEIERAARVARGVQPGAAREFCRLMDRSRTVFALRPLLSCYAFLPDDHGKPSGYTLHVPIRDYVANDRWAHDRATTLLKRHGSDPSVLDRALKILATRPLDSGSGLISYISLRMSELHPGATIYLSSGAATA